MEFGDIEQFLCEVKDIYERVPKLEETFMQVSGYPYYESVYSNILAFYFNPNEEHQLNGIVLMTLLDIINIKNEINLKEIHVFREYTTLKGNRIDIVIQNKDIVIGIENKIKASIYNDLEDYANTLNKLNKESIKVLLTLNDERDAAIQSGFINITYNEFFKKLKKNLDSYKGNKNKWYVYLLDFIKNLEGYKVEKEMEKEINEWIINNKENIDRLFKVLDIANNMIEQRLNEYSYCLESKLPNIKSKYWKGNNFEGTRYIVLDLGCNLDAYLSVDGWKLGVFIWKKTNQLKIKTILRENGYEFVQEENSHVWIYKYEYNVDIEEITDQALKLFKILNSIDNH